MGLNPMMMVIGPMPPLTLFRMHVIHLIYGCLSGYIYALIDSGMGLNPMMMMAGMMPGALAAGSDPVAVNNMHMAMHMQQVLTRKNSCSGISIQVKVT